MTYPSTFTVTEDHCKLVRQLNIRWDDYGYDGAPAVDCKRPFGNGDWQRDIAEHLEWGYPNEDETSYAQFDREIEVINERAMKIYRELDTVLLILAQNLYLTPGTYKNVYEHAPYGARYRLDIKESNG